MRLISKILIENMFGTSTSSKLMRKTQQQIDIQALKIMKRFRQNMFTKQRKKDDTLISSYQLPVIKFRHHNFARNSFHFLGTRSNCILCQEQETITKRSNETQKKLNKRKMKQLLRMHFFWKLHNNNRSSMVHHWP